MEEEGVEKSKGRWSSTKKAKRQHLDASSGTEEAILLIQSDDDDNVDKNFDEVLNSIDLVVAKSQSPKASNGKRDSKLSSTSKIQAPGFSASMQTFQRTRTFLAKNGHQTPKKRKDEAKDSPGSSKKKNGLSRAESEVVVVAKPAEVTDVRPSSFSKAQRQVCCVCLNKQRWVSVRSFVRL